MRWMWMEYVSVDCEHPYVFYTAKWCGGWQWIEIKQCYEPIEDEL